MYMTHNAKSLSQGLQEFPENENTTFLVICRHPNLTAASIIKEVTQVLTLSPFPYAMYADITWLQAGRQTISKAATPNVIFGGI